MEPKKSEIDQMVKEVKIMNRYLVGMYRRLKKMQEAYELEEHEKD